MRKLNTSLSKLLDELRGSLQPSDAVRLVYLLKAWKVLSKENKVNDVSLTFDTFYYSKISVLKLKDIFETLAKTYHIFSISSTFNTTRSKLTDEILIMLMNKINDSKTFIELADMSYSEKDYSASTQVVELGVKLLGETCTEIYSPFSNRQVISYFTDAQVYAESLADEFIVEVNKIIDNQNIEFHYVNALENPSYINPEAPHLLQQFECTLSFPPMGLRSKEDFYKKDKFNRFNIYQGRGNKDVPHFEHILAQTKGKAVVMMPVGFCYRAGVEQEFRKYLVENNLLEAVIQFPPNLHDGTNIETTFFIVNKNKSNENIQFINLNQDMFLQKGRKITLISPDNIAKIYLNNQEIDNASVIVPNDMIVDNSYSLSIDRYVLSKELKELKEKLELFSLDELQNIAEIRRSQVFNDEEKGLEVIELSPSDMVNAGYTSKSSKSKKIGSQESKLATYELQPNDILLSTKGTIGKVGIVGQLSQPAIASQAMQVIRLKENIPLDPIVLYMYLKSDIGQALLRHLVSGAAMPQISTREIKEFKVPVLSKNEMDRIIQSFNEEINLYTEIEEKKNQINNIHNNFLGEK